MPVYTFALTGLAGLIRPKASTLASICHPLITEYKGGHVPGYRYLYESCSTLTAQGSPAAKVCPFLSFRP
jgi:hypothetical protein